MVSAVESVVHTSKHAHTHVRAHNCTRALAHARTETRRLMRMLA